MMTFLLAIAILLLGLVFRLAISHLGFNDDVITNAGWGEWIYYHGARGFYENNVWTYSWPTQPPLISLIYGLNYWLYIQLLWFFSYVSAVIIKHNIFVEFFSWYINFVKWFDKSLFAETPFKYGFLISMKLIAITTDLLIALGVFLLSRAKNNNRKALLIMALFLIMPFTWYVSALWGQYDQLASFLLVGAFISLFAAGRRVWYFFILSALLLVLSVEIKPTGLILLPFFAIYFLYQKPRPLTIFCTLILSGCLVFILSYPFANQNTFLYTLQVIYPKVFFAGRSGALSTHTFNFWQLVAPTGGWVDQKYLFMQAKIWNVIIVTAIYLLGLFSLRRVNSLGNLFFTLYLVSAGIYIFGTGMLDRYFYQAAIFLLVASIYNKHLWKWWILSGLLFSINLFYSWGFPFFDKYSAWNNSYVIEIGSLAQVVVYILCVRTIFKTQKRIVQS